MALQLPWLWFANIGDLRMRKTIWTEVRIFERICLPTKRSILVKGSNLSPVLGHDVSSLT